MTRPSNQPPALALLGLLLTGPQHGYELHREFSRSLRLVWRMGLSQMYAQLKLLEVDGYIASQTELQANRPARKVFQITPKGEAAFYEWLHQPTPYVNRMRLELLTRLYYFQRLGLPGLEQLIASQKEVCRQRAGVLAAAVAASQDAFKRLVLSFRQTQLEATLQWLDSCLNDSEQE